MKRDLDLGPDGLGCTVGWGIEHLSDRTMKLLRRGFIVRLAKKETIKRMWRDGSLLRVDRWFHGASYGSVEQKIPKSVHYVTTRIGPVMIDHLTSRRELAAQTLRLMSVVEHFDHVTRRLNDERLALIESAVSERH